MDYGRYRHAVTLAPDSPLLVSLQYRPVIGEPRHICDVADNPFIAPVRWKLRFLWSARPGAVPAAPAITVEDVRGSFG
jgi:hypothetical protein